MYQVGPKGSVHALSRSSFPDFYPTFSPDGTQIAFCSARSGDMSRVWVARADGSEPRQLTGDMQGGQYRTVVVARRPHPRVCVQFGWPIPHLDHRCGRRKPSADHERGGDLLQTHLVA